MYSDPLVKPFKINGIIRGLGYAATVYVAIVGFALLTGRAADFSIENETVETTFLVLYAVAIVTLFLVLKLIDSVSGN